MLKTINIFSCFHGLWKNSEFCKRWVSLNDSSGLTIPLCQTFWSLNVEQNVGGDRTRAHFRNYLTRATTIYNLFFDPGYPLLPQFYSRWITHVDSMDMFFDPSKNGTLSQLPPIGNRNDYAPSDFFKTKS